MLLTCTKCDVTKESVEFHKRLDGYQTRCKECISTWYKNMYRTDPDYRADKLTQHHKDIADKPEYRSRMNARSREYYIENPDYYRNKNYKRLYKITVVEYEQLSAYQMGLCALCGKPQAPSKGDKLIRLAVDHDHSHHPNDRRGCKECIRGLLCNSCNRYLIPMLEASPHLQNDFVRDYLTRRPFLQKGNEIANSLVEPKVLISEAAN